METEPRRWPRLLHRAWTTASDPGQQLTKKHQLMLPKLGNQAGVLGVLVGRDEGVGQPNNRAPVTAV